MDSNWRSLFTGLDLRGWQTNPATASRWRVQGEHIALLPGTANPENILWTDSDFGDAEFVVDCRSTKPAPGQEPSIPCVFFRTDGAKMKELKLKGAKPEVYQRFIVHVKGGEVTVMTDGQPTQKMTFETGASSRGPLGLGDDGGGSEFMNLYVGSSAGGQGH